MQGRTRLIVTHRIATAARVDLVAWLDGGRVRACAPHRELWSDPAYRAIFRPTADPETPEPAAPVDVDKPPDPAPTPDDETREPATAAEADMPVGTPADLAPGVVEVARPPATLAGSAVVPTARPDSTRPGAVGVPVWVRGPAVEAEEALRPEPDDEREDEPPPASAPPGRPEIPAEDEIAASAVAATANDPQAAFDVRAAVPLAAGGPA